MNRYEIARSVAEKMGFNPDIIRPVELINYNGKALRHINGIISVEKAKSNLDMNFLDVEQTIIKSLQKN